VEDFTTNDIAEVRRFYRLRNPQFAASIREFGDFLKSRGWLKPARSTCSTPSEEESARFVGHLRKDRGLAESTIRGHCAYLRRFFQLLGIDQAKSSERAVQFADADRFIRPDVAPLFAHDHAACGRDTSAFPSFSVHARRAARAVAHAH